METALPLFLGLGILLFKENFNMKHFHVKLSYTFFSTKKNVINEIFSPLPNNATFGSAAKQMLSKKGIMQFLKTKEIRCSGSANCDRSFGRRNKEFCQPSNNAIFLRNPLTHFTGENVFLFEMALSSSPSQFSVSSALNLNRVAIAPILKAQV